MAQCDKHLSHTDYRKDNDVTTPKAPAKQRTARNPKAPATQAEQGYTRVPVTNVWKTEDEIEKRPIQKYDWIGIGDTALQRPGDWLLIAEDAPTSLSSNITAQRVATLNGPRFVGWKFRGRITEMVNAPGTVGHNRGKVWIRADRTRVDV